ncbi:MAG TPA: T9SS type A sorting domain-containing protein [Chitinophagaceae bacterium]|nr:T9SS type A sorting domain-containing protein [Chitinophagaceae bacterium]
MHRVKLFTVCIGLLACGQDVSAQSISPSVLNATGGSQSVGPNTFEWSVGEMTLVSTASAGSIIVTQGLLQPIQAPSAIGSTVMNAEDLSVFPVPASSVLNIKPAFKQGGRLDLLLLDATGRTVLHSEAVLKTGTEMQELNIGSIANGNYMLNISYHAAGNLNRQSYKIQKIN